MRAEYIARAWGLAGYDAVNLGENEFNFGSAFIMDALKRGGIPAVGGDADAGALPYRIIDRGGLRIAAVGFRDGGLKRADGEAPPAPPLEETVAAARAEADMVVCLAHVPDAAAARAFAAACPAGIDVVVAGHRGDLIPGAEKIKGRWLVYVRPWNRYVGVLEMKTDRDGKFNKCKSTLIPLTREMAEDETARALVAEYREALRELVRSKGLLAKPTVTPPGGGAYAGAAACATCHEMETASWRASGHARAYESLVADGRDFDPACVKCHVTGYGFRGGFESMTATPDRAAVGCEECHGAAGDHLETGAALSTVTESTCRRCHQAERDPNFDYASDRALVAHKK